VTETNGQPGPQHAAWRSRLISLNRLTRREAERLYAAGENVSTDEYDRPKTRGECLAGEHAARPCPFVSCKHHLYLDVDERTGSIKLNFPKLEPWELKESCTLDVAERDGVTLQDIGGAMNVTRERIRQIEARALVKLRRSKHTPEPP
jgi:hypothetical protein